MSQRFKNSGPSLSVSAPAAETSVRQLIANGKFKTALDSAKENHKAQGTAASEALLLDAYAARIQSLFQQDLVLEAKSLLQLVQQRYPTARVRMEALSMSVAARSGGLEELLQSLGDPDLSAERRVAIEHAVQTQVCDLEALAGCNALTAEHPLRVAASTLHRAFIAVTSGPVAEDALTLPEVSHRSPLAPWKLLIRAIGSFYRGDDASCQEYLYAIHPESAAARLIPSIQAMTGATHAVLTPAAAALVAQVTANIDTLRRALETLERSFAYGNPGAIYKAIRVAVAECHESAPGRLERLKQHIAVRCALADLNEGKVTAALGGSVAQDASFARLFARTMEETEDPEDLALACAMWDRFRQLAIQEGWFTSNGPESAALYLHMASVLRRIPADLLEEFQESRRSRRDKMSGEDYYFLDPEKLYERACALDPHVDAFSQWFTWARQVSNTRAEQVAESWHKIRPMDIEPVLFLMEETARRSAFPTALRYLDKAEQIDGVHPSVRRARLRLLTASVLRHLQQNKHHLADEKVVQMAALPQSQQGDRPALLAALRYLAIAARGRKEQASAAYTEVTEALQSEVAAALLVFGLAAASKHLQLSKLPSPRDLSDSERSGIPGALARVVALAEDMHGTTWKLPLAYLEEAEAQVSRNGHSIGTKQLQTLAEAGLNADRRKLAYMCSALGLERGGITECAFLLLRAKSLPEWQTRRRAACAAAAVEMARAQRDMQLVEQAVQAVHRFAPDGLTLTASQAAEVLKREKAEPAFPSANRAGPDYRDLLEDDEPCQCPSCRRDRGEIGGPFDDDDDDFDDDLLNELEIPLGMPPEVAKMLLEATVEAVQSGESLDDLLSRLSGRPPKKRKKRRHR